MLFEMQSKDLEPRILELIQKLEEKYKEDDQDLATHLEGLLNTSYLKYWDYIQLDTLLSLQKPRTDFPDELIFITYHQITELYFKLIQHEIGQLKESVQVEDDFFLKKITRMNWFLGNLISSFDIIAVGMEQDQFLKFRSALHPASGFQSVQYRMIEIASTDFINLVSSNDRDSFSDYSTIDDMFDNIYWKKGAIDSATGKKTLTLRQFEEKYSDMLLKHAHEYQFRNVWSIFKRLSNEAQNDQEIIQAMKRYDTYVNINWPLAHYKYAVSYLFKSGHIKATGGTNWAQYLPPRFQKRIFFPDLYSEQEVDEWGKAWVETEVLSKL
ncbi:tryptophan 2,3-dioxygenase family protein [Cytophagaceae bacterium ABcell3]|nr:tryptophan 2,3-dioxygenase family protein [Cytophagaceae bacterium ABcell3]